MGEETGSRDPIGPVDALRVPRYAGLRDVRPAAPARRGARADVAVLGVPFDGGVTLPSRRAVRAAHIRQASRLLRPYNPALDVSPFAAQQVVDAGDIAANPFDIEDAHRRDLERRGELRHGRRGCWRSAATTRSRCRCCAPWPSGTGRSPCCTSTRTSTRGTPTSASRTPTARPFRRASEEGLIDAARSVHVGIRGPLYGAHGPAPRAARLGFATLLAAPSSTGSASPGRSPRCASGSATPPVYVSVDIDVLDPAHRAGHRHARGRRPDVARAARDRCAAWPGIDVVACRHRRGRAGLRPRRGHRHRRGARRPTSCSR